jgi:hypothetical protein
MKFHHYIEDEGIGGFKLKIKIESETTEETYELVKLGDRIKRPIETFGEITNRGAYLWVCIPLKSMDWKKLNFGNDI